MGKMQKYDWVVKHAPTFKEGRKCLRCKHTLSVYNPNSYCSPCLSARAKIGEGYSSKLKGGE